MQNFRKVLSVLLAVMLLVSLCSCGSKGETADDEEVIIEYQSDYTSTDTESDLTQDNDENQESNDDSESIDQNDDDSSSNKSSSKINTNKNSSKTSSNKNSSKINSNKNNSKVSSNKNSSKINSDKNSNKTSSNKNSSKVSSNKNSSKISSNKNSNKTSSNKNSSKINSSKNSSKASSVKNSSKASSVKNSSKENSDKASSKISNSNKESSKASNSNKNSSKASSNKNSSKASSNKGNQTDSTTSKSEEDNKKVNTIKVLAIGNSYSNNTTRYISKIADATKGNTTVYAASLYFPGATFQQHIAIRDQWESIFADHTLEETKEIFYSSETPSSRRYECLSVGGKNITTVCSLYEAIRYEDWDYITIQQSPDGCDDYSTYDPWMFKLYDYIQAEYERDDMKDKTCPPILIHQTWAFNNDMAQNDAYEYYPVDYANNTEMFKKVEEVYNKAAQELGEAKNVTIPLIKSGEAVELAQAEFGYRRSASEDLTHNTLYADHISHLNERGSYLTACVWIETLAKLEGVTIDTRTTSYFPLLDGFGVDDCQMLQYIARRVVHGER